MNEKEMVKEIRRSVAIFSEGCGNTIVARVEPEECEECVEALLGHVRKVLNNEVEPYQERFV